jgi:hypothetical protein
MPAIPKEMEPLKRPESGSPHRTGFFWSDRISIDVGDPDRWWNCEPPQTETNYPSAFFERSTSAMLVVITKNREPLRFLRRRTRHRPAHMSVRTSQRQKALSAPNLQGQHLRSSQLRTLPAMPSQQSARPGRFPCITPHRDTNDVLSTLLSWPTNAVRLKLKRWLRIGSILVLAIAVVALAAAWMLWNVEQHLPVQRPSTFAPTPFHFWLQVITGKWLPLSSPYLSTDYLFSLSAVFGLMLGLAPLIALLGLIFKFVDWLKQQRAEFQSLLSTLNQEQLMAFMKSVDLEKLKVLSMRNSIIARLTKEPEGDIEDLVDRGIEEGEQVFYKKHLPTLLGDAKAEKVRKALDDIEIDRSKGKLKIRVEGHKPG